MTFLTKQSTLKFYLHAILAKQFDLLLSVCSEHYNKIAKQYEKHTIFCIKQSSGLNGSHSDRLVTQATVSVLKSRRILGVFFPLRTIELKRSAQRETEC